MGKLSRSKRDRRDLRDRDPVPGPRPDPSGFLTLSETWDRLEPHMKAIGRAFAEAIDKGIHDPVVIVARQHSEDPYEIVSRNTAGVPPVFAEFLRLVRGGDMHAVLLLDGTDFGAVRLDVQVAPPCSSDDLIGIIYDRWRDGLCRRYDTALDPVVYVRVCDATNEVTYVVSERLALIGSLSEQGGRGVEQARRPSAAGSVPIWLHRPHPWRLEAYEVPRELLDGPNPPPW